jgi:hypothetical protein
LAFDAWTRGAHVLAADAVAVERERQQLDAHRGQRAAADLDVADALDLRQPLADDVRDGVVDLPGVSVREVSARMITGASDGFALR